EFGSEFPYSPRPLGLFVSNVPIFPGFSAGLLWRAAPQAISQKTFRHRVIFDLPEGCVVAVAAIPARVSARSAAGRHGPRRRRLAQGRVVFASSRCASLN